ncbi:NUDIX domain-containing protein [Paenisporosarcina sp. NPDC076898]|uniref:NUDIX domain-containing protein n=1 Tax=unclassified Paenisporosarcina TaxID=2642018 RepID=UPI003D00DE2F
MTTTYVNWGKSRIKLTWTSSYKLPQPELITSVHAICFHQEKLLLVDIKNRGWNFPGGHIEQNESPLECVKREVMEEACVEGDCTYLGYVEVNHSENPSWNSNSPYPLIGYQVMYRMDITRILPFDAIFESAQRIFIQPFEVPLHCEDWHEVYADILSRALSYEIN